MSEGRAVLELYYWDAIEKLELTILAVADEHFKNGKADEAIKALEQFIADFRKI